MINSLETKFSSLNLPERSRNKGGIKNMRIEKINTINGTYKGVAFEEAEYQEIKDCCLEFGNKIKQAFGNLAKAISKVDFEQLILCYEEGKIVKACK
jgi:hypothetical protein